MVENWQFFTNLQPVSIPRCSKMPRPVHQALNSSKVTKSENEIQFSIFTVIVNGFFGRRRSLWEWFIFEVWSLPLARTRWVRLRALRLFPDCIFPDRHFPDSISPTYHFLDHSKMRQWDCQVSIRCSKQCRQYISATWIGKFLGMPRIRTGATACEARTLSTVQCATSDFSFLHFLITFGFDKELPDSAHSLEMMYKRFQPLNLSLIGTLTIKPTQT